MSIDRRDIARIADLAKLDIAEDELNALARECRAILEHFEVLREAELPETPEIEGALGAREPPSERAGPDPLQLRPDEIAPAWVEGFFVLPRLPALDDVDEPL